MFQAGKQASIDEIPTTLGKFLKTHKILAININKQLLFVIITVLHKDNHIITSADGLRSYYP